MNKIMKYRQSFYIIFTVFVMALALPVLLINSLFYYSDYNTSLVVNLKVNNEENSIPESLINEFSSESNVTKIDFQTNSITFQNADYEDVKSFTENIIEDPDAIGYSLSWVNPTTNESSIVNKAIGMISIFSVVSIAVSIYFVYQKSTARKGLITVGQITAFIIAGVIVSTLLQLTYLSIVSRVYQLTELDILTIVVAGIWTSIIASFAYIQQRYSSQNSLRSFIKELKTKVLMLRHYKLSVVLFLIIPMFIGLGTQFVIPGILLAGALLSPLASFLTLLRIYERILEKRKSNASSPNKELPTFHSNASSSKKGKVKNKPWQKRFKKKRKQ